MDRDETGDQAGHDGGRREERAEGYVGALTRHFADLRDGTHGGVTSRHDKEGLFAAAVALLDPYVRQVLGEIDGDLLLGTGEVTGGDVRSSGDGGVEAVWSLSWPAQRAAGVGPILVRAHYGARFHHPHLRGGTVGDWPLNVFTCGQAAAEVPTLRAIVAADLHNLVFQSDYRIVPAITRGSAGAGRVVGAEPGEEQ